MYCPAWVESTVSRLLKRACLLVLCCAEALCSGVVQPAQAVRWSHWLLGHAASWQRDDMRLRDMLPRVATLPLGSGEAPLSNSSSTLSFPESFPCVLHGQLPPSFH